jgi:hypothetical protein
MSVAEALMSAKTFAGFPNDRSIVPYRPVTPQYQKYRIEEQQRAAFLVLISMTREKERQRVARIKAVLSASELRLLFLPPYRDIEVQKRRNLDLTRAPGEPAR